MSKTKSWMTGDKVKVGDKLVKYRFVANREREAHVSFPETIKSIVDDAGQREDCYYGHNASFAVGRQRTIEWLVERDEDSVGSVFSFAPAKVINEFPDFCTRCGRPAYVGLFEVTHKNEAAAADCPARRK